jgi:hypothetical protein
MRAGWVAGIGSTFLLALIAAGQDPLKSGPQPAAKGQPPTKIPQSFEAHTFNGRHADRFHCVVCENDFFPTVLIFLKEPAKDKDAAIKAFLAKLDDLVPKYQALDQYPEVTGFSAYAIFLNEAAQSSLTKPDEKDPTALVKEATDRRELYKRMREWAKPLKNVTIGVAVPEAVKEFQINKDAEMTVLYYDAFNVLENLAFAPGAFKDEDIAPIFERVEKRLQEKIAVLEKGKKTKLGGRK